jgi:hypothetical protein
MEALLAKLPAPLAAFAAARPLEAAGLAGVVVFLLA